MTRIVRLKIDVSKIDKARLFQGAKGTYLDATVFIKDEEDQYGNHGMITQDVSKEEREAGTRGNILGNVKIAKVLEDDRPAQPAAAATAGAADDNEEIPF